MRLAFMGTPEFSVPAMAELAAAGHEIVAVYTKAPQPAGRGQKLKKSPVHRFAEKNGFEVRCPASFKSQEARAAFRALDLDAAFVVAYGLILPQAVLDAPRLGCFNLHASLLPRWRGAAPIHRAIMAGDAETGVQVMRMEAGLDTGPILLSETTPIRPDDTTGSLHERLAALGADLAPRALAALARGGAQETPQSEAGITYADKITADEARIDWRRPAREVDWHIRGLSPFPGAWFYADVNGKETRIKALMSKRSDDQISQEPGTVMDSTKGLTIACGDGAVVITVLQREGKSAQSALDFTNGASVKPGFQVS